MIAYKGFQPGLICKGYQFQMGLNVTTKANCHLNGFHCAENPLDCLFYCPMLHQSEYYVVKAEGDRDEDGLDSKISCTKLTILKRMSLKELFLHGLAYMVDHPARKWSGVVSNNNVSASSGYAVVRSPDPVAKGRLGDYLAFAKEDKARKEIIQISLALVDGKEILPGVWYDTNLHERQV